MAQNIDQYQYWFDTAFSDRITVTLENPQAEMTVPLSISTENISEGFHYLNTRFRSSGHSDGIVRWSAVKTDYFVRIPISVEGLNVIVAYERWFDVDFAHRITETFDNKKADVTSFQEIDVSSLSDGFHYQNIRFQDVDGNWSGVKTDYFVKTPLSVDGINTVVGYEHWFDVDFEGRITKTFDKAQVDTTFVKHFDVSSLSEGFHYQNIRFKDADGNWSAVKTDYFIKSAVVVDELNTIVGYEHWFDVDFDSRIAQSFETEREDTTLLQYFDVASLSNGFHYQNIRFQDLNGNWSTTKTDYFIKTEVVAEDINQIVSYEYWFDDDESQKVVTDLDEPKLDATIVFDVDISQLTEGQHVLNTRFFDTQGMSVVQSDYFNLEASGMEVITISNVMMYPNPTTDVLNIRTSKPYSVSILDMQGKVVWASTLMQSELKVNLSYLDAGVYHVVFKDATSTVSSKIVLQ